MNTIKTAHEAARNLALNDQRPNLGKCSDCNGGGSRLVPDHYYWQQYVVVTCHRCGGVGRVAKIWT